MNLFLRRHPNEKTENRHTPLKPYSPDRCGGKTDASGGREIGTNIAKLPEAA
jgi:hypothetical protein